MAIVHASSPSPFPFAEYMYFAQALCNALPLKDSQDATVREPLQELETTFTVYFTIRDRLVAIEICISLRYMKTGWTSGLRGSS